MPQRHVVAAAGEIAAGGRKLVNVAGREIGIFNVAGDYYALANRCPHEGGSLCEGFVTGIARSDGPNDYRMERKGEFLRCPWHGWEYDIKTGQCIGDRRQYLRKYEVVERDDDVFVIA